MFTYGLFVIGFFLLIKGADWLVEGSSSLARRWGITDLVIGLTIVSMGTSMPELVVNVIASIEGSAGIAIGNVFGSNIANVLLILGISAIVKELPIHRNTVLSEIPFSLAAAFLIGFLANTTLFDPHSGNLSLNRIDAGIILFFFGMFMVYIMSLPKPPFLPEGGAVIHHLPLWRAVLLTVAGMLSLFFGGKWVVEGAIKLALSIGMSEAFVGLTVVAVGTSLPELVTSAVAAYRKNTDIAVGNVVGSNIFNLLFVLGISSLIRPIPFEPAANTDLLVVIFSGCLIILFLALGRKLVISRSEGLIFVLLYVAYCWYLIERG